MSVNVTTTDPSLDLLVGEGGRPGWNQPDRRRRAFHNMHAVFRYSLGIRAPEVLRLGKVVDRRIGDLASVRRLTGTAYFSGMVAVRGGDVLFERYAPDFGPHQPHSVQSITKTTMNLVVGLLVEQGTDRSRPGGASLPARHRLRLRHRDGAGRARHERDQRLLGGLRRSVRERVPPGGRDGLAAAGPGRPRDRRTGSSCAGSRART